MKKIIMWAFNLNGFFIQHDAGFFYFGTLLGLRRGFVGAFFLFRFFFFFCDSEECRCMTLQRGGLLSLSKRFLFSSNFFFSFIIYYDLSSFISSLLTILCSSNLCLPSLLSTLSGPSR